MASLNININDLPEGQNFEPLPEGWYTAEIKKAELKATGSGGQMIAVDYKIDGPTHAGRLVNFQNINIKNANPTAEEIGKGQLRLIMGAIGLATIQDTDQLVGHRLQIKLAIKPAGKYMKDGIEKSYDAGNEVKGFKAIEGGAPPMPKAMSTGMPTNGGASVPAGTGSAPPWAKPAAQ